MDGHIDILAIESSCDETAAAVVRDGYTVLSNVIYSQIDMHTVYGGVVPELASRAHIEKINYVIQKALDDAGMQLKDTDAIAVTYGPGLVGALLVGVAEAKAIAWAAKKPLIGVHHIEGHISANYIEHPDLVPPYLGLIVSGGHTHRLKSAVLNYLNQAEMKHEEVHRAALAASFQKSVVDVICEHTLKAAKDYGIKNVAVAGGVASNSGLREGLRQMCDANGLRLFIPSPIYCTDNAVMIGAAAFHEYEAGTRSGWDLNAVPGLKLGEK